MSIHSLTMPSAPAPKQRQVFDGKSGKMRLADASGNLAELATVENIIPRLRELLNVLGIEALPDDTTADNLLARLDDLIQHVGAMHAEQPQADQMPGGLDTEGFSADLAALATSALAMACGIPTAGRKPLMVLADCKRVVDSLPVVKSRGRWMTTQDRLVK